ncbi:Alpha/Beta hydrolase protein [Coniella lustricola]|uniref:Carboxypeptidase n=1 Tax=Coniella lustricola TaxID=2025994 RepID=A0A2T2ZSV3_9PEZI|nr:Alpha/Beta hydrolase protein [Coniella lustricola]
MGESYAGLLPLGNSTEDELFFWFWPSTNEAAENEILIWLNGGPGCSSMEGLLQENGPFLWQQGNYLPIQNPWGWNRLTNVIWVDQPIGTGFSQGTPTALNEVDVANQFMEFWQNFVDTFDLTGYKVYIVGESYAGMYVPYIASGMLDTNDTEYYNVSGIMVYDPCIAYDYLQGAVSVVPFVQNHVDLFPVQNLDDLVSLDETCGYSAFREEYLTYPPPGAMPDLSDLPGRKNPECLALYESVYENVQTYNPCFDIYNVAIQCPVLWDVLGFPGSFEFIPPGAEIYFNRSDVQEAIHAPSIYWTECSEVNVFPEGDGSLPSAVTVLPGVIERTQNVIVAHGLLDMVLIANGTILQIQNTTWGGLQGFQSSPYADSLYIPTHGEYQVESYASSGVMGTTHTERGLTYATVELSGHMIPQYQPSVAFRQVEVLLGRVDSLTSKTPFTVNVGAGAF